MDHVFKCETDLKNGNGFIIERSNRNRKSDIPWTPVATVDNEKNLSFAKSIKSKDEQNEITNFCSSINLI